jgi:type II secretory pathway component PulK
MAAAVTTKMETKAQTAFFQLSRQQAAVLVLGTLAVAMVVLAAVEQDQAKTHVEILVEMVTKVIILR